MTTQIKTILISIFILVNNFAYSQISNSEKKYSSIELNEDIDSLTSYLIQTHPDPFTIISKSDFEKKVIEIKSNFSKPLTIREYYRLIAPLVASLSDGHTSLKFPGTRLLTDESLLFPYAAVCNINTPNILVNDYINDSPQLIPNGSEVISVNNISSKQINDKLIENTSGENKLYRLQRGSNYPLGMLLYIYFDFEGDFIVKYKYKNKEYTKVIQPITFKHVKEVLQKRKTPSANQVKTTTDYSLILKPEISTAIIDFKFFNDEDKFKIFLETSFKTIKVKGIKNLIIDLRENGGGNSVLGDQLFQYISPCSYSQFSKTIIKYSQPQKKFFKESCEEDSAFCEMYKYIVAQPNGHRQEIQQDSLIKSNTSPNHFNGKIYLLTSLITFSSAMNFSQCFKHYKMGTIIGEETGGWIVSYGDKITTTLPISNLTLYISQKKFYTIGSSEKDLHGVIPDNIMESDKALEYTLSTIKKTK